MLSPSTVFSRFVQMLPLCGCYASSSSYPPPSHVPMRNSVAAVLYIICIAGKESASDASQTQLRAENVKAASTGSIWSAQLRLCLSIIGHTAPSRHTCRWVRTEILYEINICVNVRGVLEFTHLPARCNASHRMIAACEAVHPLHPSMPFDVVNTYGCQCLLMMFKTCVVLTSPSVDAHFKMLATPNWDGHNRMLHVSGCKSTPHAIGIYMSRNASP
jgi:hypothetical protein